MIDIKKIFLECDHRDPDGLYADDVDIIEFGNKLIAAARKVEREDCVSFVRTLNKEVANALHNRNRNS